MIKFIAGIIIGIFVGMVLHGYYTEKENNRE